MRFRASFQRFKWVIVDQRSLIRLQSTTSISHSVDPLVSTDWLSLHLSSVIPIDATCYFRPRLAKGEEDLEEESMDPKRAYKEYLEDHIDTAQFLDLKESCEEWSNFPNMLPTESRFSEIVGALGIKRDDHVVVYDSFGIQTSPRLWWMFKAFGHQKVSVLDGGLRKWKSESRPTTTKLPPLHPSSYTCSLDSERFITNSQLLEELTDYLHGNPNKILDARSHADFAGHSSEFTSLPVGHIPSSINIPAESLLNRDAGTLLSKDQLLKRFQSKKISLDDKIVTLSDTGNRAAIVYLALEVLGKTTQIQLYDGGWAQWSSSKKNPIKRYR